jgi:hypothetical protein
MNKSLQIKEGQALEFCKHTFNIMAKKRIYLKTAHQRLFFIFAILACNFKSSAK